MKRGDFRVQPARPANPGGLARKGVAMPVALKWLCGGFVTLAGAIAWALVALRFGVELGLMAWAIGAFVGLGMRGAAARGAGMASAMLAVSSITMGRALSLYWPGRHASGYWEALRWVDLLWLAMAVSAAQMTATVRLRTVVRASVSWERRFSRAFGPWVRSVRPERQRPQSGSSGRWVSQADSALRHTRSQGKPDARRNQG